jgi:NADH:ubiquinone oxidoreductase subunit 3 (subunit A)
MLGGKEIMETYNLTVVSFIITAIITAILGTIAGIEYSANWAVITIVTFFMGILISCVFWAWQGNIYSEKRREEANKISSHL